MLAYSSAVSSSVSSKTCYPCLHKLSRKVGSFLYCRLLMSLQPDWFFISALFEQKSKILATLDPDFVSWKLFKQLKAHVCRLCAVKQILVTGLIFKKDSRKQKVGEYVFWLQIHYLCFVANLKSPRSHQITCVYCLSTTCCWISSYSSCSNFDPSLAL